MVMLKQRLPTWESACAALALMAGCATDLPRPVTPPTLDPGPLPQIVEETQPKPAGHFLRSFLELSSPSSGTPTTSMLPTPPAEPTR